MAVVAGTEDKDAALVEEFAIQANEYAKSHGIRSRIQHLVVPRGVHAGGSNFPTSARFLFGG